MNILRKPIRSYVRREGRMSARQSYALQNFWYHYGLDLAVSAMNMADVFKREAPTILEIGFGMGTSLLHMAQAASGKNFIGIEVHRPGVGSLLAELAAANMTNVKVFCADAKEVLAKMITDNALEKIQIFFPDPWPKKRHHKRRLIQPEFVELLHAKLQLDGVLHLATDWQDYALQMQAVLGNVPGFINSFGEGQFAPRPTDRPLTKYEQRGQKMGHQVWDLIFIKKE